MKIIPVGADELQRLLSAVNRLTEHFAEALKRCASCQEAALKKEPPCAFCLGAMPVGRDIRQHIEAVITSIQEAKTLMTARAESKGTA